MTTLLIPSILKTKDAHCYVGGVEVWKDLMAHYAAYIKPIRTTPRGDSYFRRETIDKVVVMAEMEGKMVYDASKAGDLPDARKRKTLTSMPR